MCGIQILIERIGGVANNEYSKIWSDLTVANSRRGPDSHQEITITVGQKFRVRIGAHVLHLRGQHTYCQPLTDSNTGDVLCWNGEVFGGLHELDQNSNDGDVLFGKLQQQKQKYADFVLKTMGQIEGPYAFVYVDKEARKLWFARDFLGRRSLLLANSPDALFISSIADSDSSPDMEWSEIPAQTIYCLDLSDPAGTSLALDSCTQYKWHYPDSVEEPLFCCPHLNLPFGQVSLATDNSNDSAEITTATDLAQFPYIAQWQPYVDGLHQVLCDAINTRISTIPYRGEGKARVGVLFSGGVDCITIAAILTKMLPKHEPIELFNVAFENPRGVLASAHKNIYDVPDRKTGRSGWIELCAKIDNRRDWRFIEIDVPYSQVLAHRSHIHQLLVPSDTVMDMSIGMALWFASRGVGQRLVKTTLVDGEFERTEYTGQARVLLLGMGADEQLGGYSRHRAAWDRAGHEQLGQEIRLDFERIATRNLGRDDRIVSDNAKESRYPFLASNVISFLSSVPLNRKMDMRYPRGMGEKLLLRLLAHQLGLTEACMLAKRAIQFGARTAKMETSQSKAKGQDRLQ